MEVIIFKEKHYDRIFVVNNKNEKDEAFYKVFKDRYEEGWYDYLDGIFNEDKPIEPIKPDSNEKWIQEAYEEEKRKFEYKLNENKKGLEGKKYLDIARDETHKYRKRAARIFLEWAIPHFPHGDFDIITPEKF